MTDKEPQARLDSFEVRVRLDATVTVNGSDQHWIKPGGEVATKWRGYEDNGGDWVNPIPTEDEIRVAFKLMQKGVLAPVLEELVVMCQREIDKTRRGP